jgi:type I restriction enzyme S subunit
MPVEIADRWEMAYFDEVVELNPNDDVPDEESFPYLPMDAVNEETRTVDYWEERHADNCTRVRFRGGDTVYAKITPCTENGKIAFIEQPDGIAFGSTEFLVFRAREGRMLPKYVYYLSNLPQFRAVTISLMEGSTGRQRVPSDTFEQNIRVPVPPIEEQRTFLKHSTVYNNEVNRSAKPNKPTRTSSVG